MTALSTSTIIGVIGAGTMGAGIAQVAANAGHDVLLFDVAEGAAQKGLGQISTGLDKLVSRGKMTQADKDSLVSRVKPVSDLQDFAPCGLVVEVIVENLDIKKDLFQQLETHLWARCYSGNQYIFHFCHFYCGGTFPS